MNATLDRSTIGHLLRGAGMDAWGVASNQPRLPLAPDLDTGIVMMRRFSPQSLQGLAHGPTEAYYREYQQLNGALDEAAGVLCDALRSRGYTAQAIPATSDAGAADVEFSHKSAATRAGLGWIGKTALFVSPEFGPGVRLATVFTDLDLPAGRPVTEGLCGPCTLCVDACPAGAGRDVTWTAGMPRDDLYDAFACERYMQALPGSFGGEVCGICVAVCPYTQAAIRRDRGRG